MIQYDVSLVDNLISVPRFLSFDDDYCTGVRIWLHCLEQMQEKIEMP